MSWLIPPMKKYIIEAADLTNLLGLPLDVSCAAPDSSEGIVLSGTIGLGLLAAGRDPSLMLPTGAGAGDVTVVPVAPVPSAAGGPGLLPAPLVFNTP